MPMIKQYLLTTQKLLNSMQEMQRKQLLRRHQLSEYENLVLKINRKAKCTTFYNVLCESPTYVKVSSSQQQSKKKNNNVHYRYLGKSSSREVNRIKEARYLKKSLKVIEKNIKCLTRVINELQPCDQKSINQLLPKVYQDANLTGYVNPIPAANTWKAEALKRKARYPEIYPENLKHKTADGTMVRSKSEVIIYNFLLSLGVTFVYELPIETPDGRLLRPDFTILSEIDYQTVVMIEHQGMMDVPEYRDKLGVRVHSYLSAGYVPNLDVFFTFDSSDIGINTEIIQDIIDARIRPNH